MSRSLKNHCRQLRFEGLEDRRLLAVFTVDNISDGSIPGSLRTAIDDANIDDGLDQIVFDLNASQMAAGITISNSPLKITAPVQILGDNIANPALDEVTIRAAFSATNAFEIDATVGEGITNGFAFQDLVINGGIEGFDDAIQINQLPDDGRVLVNRVTIENNVFDGIDISPSNTSNFSITIQNSTIRNNDGIGIHAHDAGGTSATVGVFSNTIVSNRLAGIKYDNFDAQINIQNNNIGVTVANSFGSNDVGVWISSSSSTAASLIGNNTISGNVPNLTGIGAGIHVQGSNYPALDIDDNRIGTRTDSVVVPGSGNDNGIEIQGNSTIRQIDNNIIGGNITTGIVVFASDEGTISNNTIAANGGDGIALENGSDTWSIINNVIGSSITPSFGNGRDGLYIEDSFNSAFVGQIFGFNGRNGITIVGESSDRHNLVFQSGFADNRFINNAGIPIDLGEDGPTTNDDNDVDTGPNNRLNYPSIIDAAVDLVGTDWLIPFQIDVDAPGIYEIQIYRHTNTGVGSGDYNLVGVSNFNLDQVVNGIDAVFTVTIPNGTISAGDQLAVILRGLTGGVTETNTSNTSEMSPVSDPIAPDTTPPTITDVRLDNPAGWLRDPYSFSSIVAAGEQLRPIFTEGVDTLEIFFSEPVMVMDGSELKLVQTTDVPFANKTLVLGIDFSFTLDPAKLKGTWTFNTPLADGKYAIDLSDIITDAAGNKLDGEWINPTNGTPDDYTDDVDDPNYESIFVTGDGMAGSMDEDEDGDSEFRFHFALLAGDYDGDGIVEGAGVEMETGDGNGDGNVDMNDDNIGMVDKMLPLRTIGGADLNDDEIVDEQDLTYWQTGYGLTTLGGVDGDGDSDGSDFLLWQRAFGTFSAWYTGPYLAGLGGTLPLFLIGTAPTVENVTISGSISIHDSYEFDSVDGSGLQLQTVPVGGADTISIRFSELVNISADSLVIVGLQTGNLPELAEFSYDAMTMTATWRFEGWALGDQYLLSLHDSVTDIEGNLLDGEWVNPESISTVNSLVSEFPSGDGTAGGHFNFVMTLLAGDADLDGHVTINDFGILQINFDSEELDLLFTDADFDGDGDVTIGDFIMQQTNFGMNLQNLFVLADLDGDFDVDDNDLQTISDNYGMTGATYADGDLNGDGTIDDSDLDLAFAQFGLAFDWVA